MSNYVLIMLICSHIYTDIYEHPHTLVYMPLVLVSSTCKHWTQDKNVSMKCQECKDSVCL